MPSDNLINVASCSTFFDVLCKNLAFLTKSKALYLALMPMVKNFKIYYNIVRSIKASEKIRKGDEGMDCSIPQQAKEFEEQIPKRRTKTSQIFKAAVSELPQFVQTA